MGQTSSAIPVYFLILSTPNSGSTLIECALAASAALLPLGEFSAIASSLAQPESGCACGATIAHCEFWQAMRDSQDLHTQAAVHSLHIRRPPGVLSGGLFAMSSILPGWVRWYASRSNGMLAANARALTRHIEIAAAATHWHGGIGIIDKSMSASRLTDLDMHGISRKFRLAVVHLVRAPEDVVGSRVSRGIALDSAIGQWLKSNRAIRFAIAASRCQSALLSYELFCAEPAKQLTELGARLEVPLTFDETAFPVLGHALGGNMSSREDGFHDIALRQSAKRLSAMECTIVRDRCARLAERLGVPATDD